VPPEGFAAGLREAGLGVSDAELLTPLSSVQTYLRSRQCSTLLLFGTADARGYLLANGIRVADGNERDDVDAVFVAHTDVVDFEELERAARAILGGARLLTGSFVPAYAGANGPILSRGAMTTAGGLVFIGDYHGYFLALDAKSGKLLWRFQTGAGIYAPPVTYTFEGKQYVAVSSGSVVMAFALP